MRMPTRVSEAVPFEEGITSASPTLRFREVARLCEISAAYVSPLSKKRPDSTE